LFNALVFASEKKTTAAIPALTIAIAATICELIVTKMYLSRLWV
jgi:hypothetical protein